MKTMKSSHTFCHIYVLNAKQHRLNVEAVGMRTRQEYHGIPRKVQTLNSSNATEVLHILQAQLKTLSK